MASDPDMERLRDLDHRLALITARLLGAPPPPEPRPAEQDLELTAVSLTPDEQRHLEAQLRALQHERDELLRQA